MSKADELLRKSFEVLDVLNNFDILDEEETKVLQDIETYLDSPKDVPETDFGKMRPLLNTEIVEAYLSKGGDPRDKRLTYAFQLGAIFGHRHAMGEE